MGTHFFRPTQSRSLLRCAFYSRILPQALPQRTPPTIKLLQILLFAPFCFIRRYKKRPLKVFVSEGEITPAVPPHFTGATPASSGTRKYPCAVTGAPVAAYWDQKESVGCSAPEMYSSFCYLLPCTTRQFSKKHHKRLLVLHRCILLTSIYHII